jgi:hypothetical protein
MQLSLSLIAVLCRAVLSWPGLQVSADAKPKRNMLSVDRTIKVSKCQQMADSCTTAEAVHIVKHSQTSVWL